MSAPALDEAPRLKHSGDLAWRAERLFAASLALDRRRGDDRLLARDLGSWFFGTWRGLAVVLQAPPTIR